MLAKIPVDRFYWLCRSRLCDGLAEGLDNEFSKTLASIKLSQIKQLAKGL
jgi:hypothetical protein